jgi:hypothetical protein
VEVYRLQSMKRSRRSDDDDGVSVLKRWGLNVREARDPWMCKGRSGEAVVRWVWVRVLRWVEDMGVRSLRCLRVRAIDQMEFAMCRLAGRGMLYEEVLVGVSGIDVPTCMALDSEATVGLKSGCLPEFLDWKSFDEIVGL